MDAIHETAKSEALTMVKAGVDLDLALETIDAIAWCWAHADANLKPKHCLLPLRNALKRLQSRKPRKAAKSAARRNRPRREHIPGDTMSAVDILRVYKRREITEPYCETLLDRAE